MEVQINEVPRDSRKKIIGVQFPYEIYEQLKSIADASYISISDLVRAYTIRYLHEHQNK